MMYGRRLRQSFVDFLVFIMFGHLYQPTFPFSQKGRRILSSAIPRSSQKYKLSRQIFRLCNGDGSLLFDNISGIFINQALVLAFLNFLD